MVKTIIATSAIAICLPLFAKTKTTIIYNQPQASEKDCYIVATYPIPDKFNLKAEIAKQFAPEEAKTALAIVLAESSGNITAQHINNNGSEDFGLFQINSVHGYNQDILFNPRENIQIAAKIYKENGWQAWSTYKNGKYLTYL